jgi:hypothetical protein
VLATIGCFCGSLEGVLEAIDGGCIIDGGFSGCFDGVCIAIGGCCISGGFSGCLVGVFAAIGGCCISEGFSRCAGDRVAAIGGCCMSEGICCCAAGTFEDIDCSLVKVLFFGGPV